jgi:predicted nucleic acid-binding protein
LPKKPILDCCSLINLYAGWGGLSEIKALDYSWFVSEAVLAEAQHVGEYSADGGIVRVPVNLREVLDSGLVAAVKPESDQEIQDYLTFAMELDDGEAQSLALAKHRGFLLLTDDKKALRMARLPEVNVPVLTTPQVLRQWAEIDRNNASRAHMVVKRVQILARFLPAAGSPELDWWFEQLRNSPE